MLKEINESKTTSSRLGRFKPASEKFEFKEYPFYWVSRLGNRYTQMMEKQLKKVGMNITSWRVGLILREYGTISMTDVATHAVGRLPTMTKAVYRMKDRGLVRLAVSEADARVTMVAITQKGLDLIDQTISETTRTIDLAFKDMASSDVKQLNQLLKKIFKNLS